MKKYESFIVAERTKYEIKTDGIQVYFLRQVNRREVFFAFSMIANTLRSLKILLKEKPDIVVTTGVLAMVPICLLAKLLGKKLIFIESFAKTNTPTETGKLLYKFADQFYVQWESMLKIYPNAIFVGGIY
jgi:UDP-N-acetylglucosamine:LPS N-acetylglucosamine transferase